MRLRNGTDGWGGVAQLLHWLIALAVLGLAIVGLTMTGMANTPDKVRIYALHKSVGITVLVLVLLRIGWRLADRRPPHAPGMAAWQRRMATSVHLLLYALLLLMPLSGWLYNSAANFALRWFGLVSLPSLTGGADPELKAIAHEVHETGFWLLVALLVLHVGGALKHHFVDRDDTLRRMLPRRRPPLQDRAVQPPP